MDQVRDNVLRVDFRKRLAPFSAEIFYGLRCEVETLEFESRNAGDAFSFVTHFSTRYFYPVRIVLYRGREKDRYRYPEPLRSLDGDALKEQLALYR